MEMFLIVIDDLHLVMRAVGFSPTYLEFQEMIEQVDSDST
jgi:Ca2+-binding EF-hand superfamily protein